MIVAPPRPARWFQLLVARNDLPLAMDLLARRRMVELESTPEGERQPTLTPELAQRLERFRHLEETYRPFWPTPDTEGGETGTDPVVAMDHALEGIEQWRDRAAPVIGRILEARVQCEDLRQLLLLSTAMKGTPLDLGRMARGMDGDAPVALALFLIPGALPPLDDHDRMLIWSSHEEDKGEPPMGRFLVAMGARTDLEGLKGEILAAKGRTLDLPPWVSGNAEALRRESRRRLDEGLRAMRRLELELEGITQATDLARHVGRVVRMRWFLEAVESVVSGEGLALVTGWTDRLDGERPTALLREGGVRGLMGVTPPVGENPPLILHNPPWARPFEFFPRLLGMPTRHEVDPSPLLAVLAPLLFGYMFGDVGQGLVLALAGYALVRKEIRAGWLLVSGGLSATLFGFLFGSLFCREDLLPALWFHPIAHPLETLGYPMVLGVGMILGGFALEGLTFAWRGEERRWGHERLGMILLYLGLGGMMAVPDLGWLAGLGLFLHLRGGFVTHGGFGGALKSLGHLPEALMQLGVNTLSFSRVGAFALAHAGLSMAVLSLAQLAGEGVGWWLVLILGNGVILALEGLVVSIQTTRLILFEFFIRFLGGGGRVFRPLVPPVGASTNWE